MANKKLKPVQRNFNEKSYKKIQNTKKRQKFYLLRNTRRCEGKGHEQNKEDNEPENQWGTYETP